MNIILKMPVKKDGSSADVWTIELVFDTVIVE